MFKGRLQAAVVVALGATVVLAPAAFAATPGNSWHMDLSDGVVQDVNGTQPMRFSGQGVGSATGRVGGAVEFTRAPSLGTVANSQNDNPGTGNFAMGLVFTSQPIPSGHYSGNLMQKGLFADRGQVKLQLVPESQGTVDCRIKGTAGAKVLTSTVNVDDGAWHSAVCWRSGTVIGLTVDGVVRSLSWNPGSIANSKLLTLGNKSMSAGSSDQHFGRTDFTTWVIDPDARAIVEQQVAASG
jgi:hypothetical protein